MPGTSNGIRTCSFLLRRYEEIHIELSLNEYHVCSGEEKAIFCRA
jgi:hypothetical protein